MALVIVLVIVVAAGVGALLVLLGQRARQRQQPSAMDPPPAEPPPPAGEPLDDEHVAAAARSLAAELMREERFYEGVAILDDPRVAEVVQALARPSVPVTVPWSLARSRTGVMEATLGIAALRLREDTSPTITSWAFTTLKRCPPPIEPLLYALILAKADAPVIARALAIC